MQYLSRYVDEQLKRYLDVFGAVSLRGPKWCGKTTTCLQQAKTVFYLTDDDTRALARMAPSNLFVGEAPILLDEWQRVPSIWDAVRHAVDRGQSVGRFLLTGSATPRRVHHSGVGRIARLTMKSMSLAESGESSGDVRLADLLSGESPSAVQNQPNLDDLIGIIVRGGWPASIGLNREGALLVPREYIKAICDPEADEEDSEEHFHFDSERMRAVLHALARTVAQTTTKATLLRDYLGSDGVEGEKGEIRARDTLDAYLDYLRRSFVLEEQPAWSPALRSPVRIRTAPKRHLIDPSLAVAAMGATPEMLRRDVKTLGFLFESLCYRDLSVYAAQLDARVMHYRDESGLEADAIVELADGSWGAFEIKLGTDQVDKAAASLKRLADKMRAAGQVEPNCLCVIVGQGRFAMRRDDGVCVVPIGMLRA